MHRKIAAILLLGLAPAVIVGLDQLGSAIVPKPQPAPAEIPLPVEPAVATDALEIWEAVELISRECRIIEGITPNNLGEHWDAIQAYADDILALVPELGLIQEQFRPVPFFPSDGRGGCVITVFDPRPGPDLGPTLLIPEGVFIYETVQGQLREILVIYTPGIDFEFESRSA